MRPMACAFSTKRLRNSAAVIEPAKPRLAGIVDVGDVRVEQPRRRAATAAAATPDRSPPAPALAIARRPAPRRRCRRAAGRAPAPRARRRSASPCRSAGRALPRRPAPAHRRGSSRPSASVLPISTVMPLRLCSTSPGRKALPAMAFSTAGISTRSRTCSFAAMIICGKAQHVGRPAHVLLHQRHAGGRLDVEAAGVEAHALADQRDLGRARRAPGDVDEARRARAGLAHGVDHREALLERLAGDHR